jgi:hypothetical protein
VVCGIDNGSSGSIAILSPGSGIFWSRTPVLRRRNYQKHERYLLRLDPVRLTAVFRELLLAPWLAGRPVDVLLERPYCNPQGFNASLMAARTLEATLVVLDLLGLPFRFVDSKQWQSVLLPGVEGREALKRASLETGRLLFPDVPFKGDADALLMAEWARRHPPENIPRKTDEQRVEPKAGPVPGRIDRLARPAQHPARPRQRRAVLPPGVPDPLLFRRHAEADGPAGPGPAGLPGRPGREDALLAVA